VYGGWEGTSWTPTYGLAFAREPVWFELGRADAMAAADQRAGMYDRCEARRWRVGRVLAATGWAEFCRR